MNTNIRERVERLLQKAQVKRTKPRMILLETLLESRIPLSHEEIGRLLEGTGINRVTIYRVLQRLLDAGIVHRVEAGDRIWRFAVCECGRSGHCHPHFTCRICGRVECMSGYPMPELKPSPSGYQFEELEVYFRGICADCSMK